MLYNIYKITCLANGKSYIGLTRQTLAARWRQHRCRGTLSHAVRKYGADQFIKRARSTGLNREDWMATWRHGAGNKGKPKSVSHRAKMKAAAFKRWGNLTGVRMTNKEYKQWYNVRLRMELVELRSAF